MESSESDGYEDVMSGEEEEEGTVVKSQWTNRAKVTTSTTTAAAAEVSSTAVGKSLKSGRVVQNHLKFDVAL